MVLVETEFWPNLLADAAALGFPSPSSMDESPIAPCRAICGCAGCGSESWPSISLVLAQSEEDAKRLKAIGAPAARVFV